MTTLLHKVIDAVGRLGIAPPVVLPEDGSKHELKRAVLALYAVPGTFEMCTTCRNHGQRYRGAHYGQAALADTKGWFYCDRIVEAETIVQPVEGSCHWYRSGGKTHRTPLPGVRQALNPNWRPGPVLEGK